MFPDVAVAEVGPRFSEMKEDSVMNVAITKVVIEHGESKVNGLNQCLTEKWGHFMSLPAYFHGKLVR